MNTSYRYQCFLFTAYELNKFHTRLVCGTNAHPVGEMNWERRKSCKPGVSHVHKLHVNHVVYTSVVPWQLIISRILIYKMKKNNGDTGCLECQVFKHYRYFKKICCQLKKLDFQFCLETS